MKKLAFTLLMLATTSAFASFDASQVDSWNIPEGNVAQVKIGDDVVWPPVPYITDGLVSWWDGKWNNGIGLHSDSTTVWKDLIGGRDAELFGEYSWSNDTWNVVSVESDGLARWNAANLPESQTWEIVIYPTNGVNAGRILDVNYGPTIRISTNNPNKVSLYTSYGVTANSDIIPWYRWNQLHQHTLVHEKDSPNVKYYIDGTLIHTWDSATTNSTGKDYGRFADANANTRGIDASYYSVKLYNRVLTEDEILHNTVVNHERFGIPQMYSVFEFDDGSRVVTNITNVANRAYQNNTNLKNAVLGNSCTSIGDSSFQDATSLTNIIIPETVTLIDNSAFYHCYGLTNIDLPNTLSNINQNVFYACTNLPYISIPTTITNIESLAFGFCYNLESIDGLDNVRKLASSFRGCTNLTSIVLNSIEDIGSQAFMQCSKLSEITFGSNLTTIGADAFSGCTSLQTIKYYKKDTETNAEGEARIKNLIENSGFNITGKEFICLNYDYTETAWSWIDLTDVETLWTDEQRTNHPAIGERTISVDDKIISGNSWFTQMNRADSGVGLTPGGFNDETGRGDLGILRQSIPMYEANTYDISNCEFAVVYIVTNDRFPNKVTGRMQLHPAIFRVCYINLILTVMIPGKMNSTYVESTAGAKPLGYDGYSKQTIYSSRLKGLGVNNMMYAVRYKVVDGIQTTKISVNGGLLRDVDVRQIDEETPTLAIVPSVNYYDYGVLPYDYLENIWWKEIPEDWDKIERALMYKYNITPLSEIYPEFIQDEDVP